MPTGYTAKLCDGDQTFEEFVWLMARAMGPLIHMRDCSFSTPLTFPTYSFAGIGSKEKIAERERDLADAIADLRRVETMTPLELEETHREAKLKAWNYYVEICSRVTPVRDRLLRMRIQVETWSPPTKDHVGFKEFMLHQLNETIKWDGTFPDEPDIESDTSVWLQTEIAWRKRHVERCAELLDDERRHGDVAVDRIAWLESLIASVEPPPGNFLERRVDRISAITRL